MNLLYKSTRNSEKTVTASQAILKGLADDGGLFVPVSIPRLDVSLDELNTIVDALLLYLYVNREHKPFECGMALLDIDSKSVAKVTTAYHKIMEVISDFDFRRSDDVQA